MIPEGWRRARLGTVLDGIDAGWSPQCASHPAEPDVWGVLKVSAVTSGRYLDTENKALPEHEIPRPELEVTPGDLLLARANGAIDLVGKTALVRSTRSRLMLSDKLLRLSPKVGTSDAAFLHAVLSFQPIRDSLMNVTGGSHMRNISQSSLRELEVVCPPLGEQKKIAAILSSVDEAIQSTQAVVDQLQVVKKAMMGELLTGGLPGRHKAYRLTEAGRIPEEWGSCQLGQVAVVGNGATPSKARVDYWNGGTIPWLPTGKVNDRKIVSADEFVTSKALQECSIRLLPKGTILIAMIGQGKTRGKVAYLGLDATINQNFAFVQPNKQLRSWFLFAYLEHCYEQIRSTGRGSNQDALNCGIIKSLPVPLPPIGEQERIERTLLAFDERDSVEQGTVAALNAVKSALLSVLLTGEVRVTPAPEAP